MRMCHDGSSRRYVRVTDDVIAVAPPETDGGDGSAAASGVGRDSSGFADDAFEADHDDAFWGTGDAELSAVFAGAATACVGGGGKKSRKARAAAAAAEAAAAAAAEAAARVADDEVLLHLCRGTLPTSEAGAARVRSIRGQLGLDVKAPEYDWWPTPIAASPTTAFGPAAASGSGDARSRRAEDAAAAAAALPADVARAAIELQRKVAAAPALRDAVRSGREVYAAGDSVSAPLAAPRQLGLTDAALALLASIGCSCGAGSAVGSGDRSLMGHSRACNQRRYDLARARTTELAEARTRVLSKMSWGRAAVAGSGGASGPGDIGGWTPGGIADAETRRLGAGAFRAVVAEEASKLTLQMQAAEAAASHVLFVLSNSSRIGVAAVVPTPKFTTASPSADRKSVV